MNNKKVVLIMGKPNSGKSTSLASMTNQEQWVYLNSDLKELPFKDNFAANMPITDPNHVKEFIAQIEGGTGVYGGILDTVTKLMDMYERMHVKTALDTRAAWGGYSDFYNEVMHQIKAGTKSYAILAHAHTKLNEQTHQLETLVPVKGAVGKVGVESDYTIILGTQEIDIETAEANANDMLTLSDEEREDGFKRVFCTRVTKDTMGSKMRAPMGMFKRNELYIDNNIQKVFERIDDYYR